MADNLGLIELVLVASITLGWAFRELWLLRRPPRKRDED